MLVQLFVLDEQARDYSYKLRVFDRLYEIAYMSSIGQITKESGTGYLRSMRKVRDDLLNTLTHGVGSAANTNKEKTAPEEKRDTGNKLSYVAELNGLGTFTDFRQVLCAQHVLNDMISGNTKK